MITRCELRNFGWRAVVANLWDWLFRRSCWGETACWMMGIPGSRLLRDSGRGPKGEYCPDGAKEWPGCWCGKFCPEGHGHDPGGF